MNKNTLKLINQLQTISERKTEIEEKLHINLVSMMNRKGFVKCREILFDVPESIVKCDLLSVIYEMELEGRKRF